MHRCFNPMKSAFIFAYLILTTTLFSSGSWAACGDSYNLNHHHVSGKLDICSIENELSSELNLLINWGNRPVWIDNDTFVFLSNTVGDVYQMDLPSNTVTLLSGHFKHSGFARVHALANGDLLLHGPTSGSQPPMDPLVINEEGRFTGDMFILKAPYSGLPIPLGVHAWEGIAVSSKSNQIAWSDVNKPFFGRNIIESGLNYMFGRSNLWTGTIEYNQSGIPSITNKKKILSKYPLTFHEPQDFKGSNDQKLLFSMYGPGAEGSSDMFVYNLETGSYKKKPSEDLGYNEWEGIHPDYSRAFYERDPDASQTSGPGHIDTYLWDFKNKVSIPFSHFRRDDGFSIGNSVFSPDGNWILMSTDSALGNEVNAPGYSVGIVLIDYQAWLASPQVFN